MHTALIVVDKPNTRGQAEAQQKWLGFEHDVQGIESEHKGVERLAENTFLIPLQSALPALTAVLGTARKCEIDYRILFFEKAPDWVYSRPNSTARAAK